MSNNIIIKKLGLKPYEQILLAMHHFSDFRDFDSIDEIWLVQHPPIFTQGQTGKLENLIVSGNIPVLKSDRGGQITYHGPGQQIIYVMLNLRRRKLCVRDLITLLEKTVIITLDYFEISGHIRPNFPGVYVDNKKICSIGLRIKKGFSLHGLALNISMDLSPFFQINPCGLPGLCMTQVSDLAPSSNINDVVSILTYNLLFLLNSNYKKNINSIV